MTGATGPTGATGVTSLDSTLVDNDGLQTVAANALVDLGETINNTGTSLIFTAPDTVTLAPGTYFILFNTLVSNSTTPGDVGASLLVNGVVVNNAAEYVPATTTQTQVALMHNLTVTETTPISVRNASTVPNIYHDTSLSIIKLA